MLIKDFGGEFELIKKLLPVSCANAALLLPNGDDAAVVQSFAGPLVATVDSVVEGKHFSFEYFSPEQVGIRAIEGAASDIAAVGGVARFVLCALILPERIEVEVVQGIYRGLSSALARIGAVMIGGDTSSGSDKLSIAVTVLGEIPRSGRFMPRSGAKPGDLLMVSGGLGGSAAGLELLRAKFAGHEDVKRYHLEPKCRVDLGVVIAAQAHAAIDISDGLSSELHHLCSASSCGALIDFEKIPVKNGVIEAAQLLKLNSKDLILHGGEEYELLYAVPKEKSSTLPGVVIGEVTAGRELQLRTRDGLAPLVPKGFVHLR